MSKQKLIIRSIGIGIIIFASAHLFLNLFIIISRYILPSDELQKIVKALSRIFGPIAVREDMNIIMLLVKLNVSALFLLSGTGMIRFKEWSRRLVFCLLGLRVIYGFAYCLLAKVFLIHSVIILAEGVALSYYLTRAGVREEFR